MPAAFPPTQRDGSCDARGRTRDPRRCAPRPPEPQWVMIGSPVGSATPLASSLARNSSGVVPRCDWGVPSWLSGTFTDPAMELGGPPLPFATYHQHIKPQTLKQRTYLDRIAHVEDQRRLERRQNVGGRNVALHASQGATRQRTRSAEALASHH